MSSKKSSLGSCKQIMCQLFQQYQFFHINNQTISNQVRWNILASYLVTNSMGILSWKSW